MSSLKEYSPFYKIRQPLKLLRWTCGFPLQWVDDSFTQFRFIPWVEYTRFSILLFIFLLEYIYWIMIDLIYDGNLDNFFAFYEEAYSSFSSSLVDQLSTWFISVTALMSSFAFLFVFKYNATSISKMCKEVKNLNSKLASKYIKINQKRKKFSTAFFMTPSVTVVAFL